MKKKSFMELYQEAKQKPTPAQSFIAEIAALTHRSNNTVKMWTMGKQVPDELAQSLIAEKYDVDIVTLFPKREEAPAVSIPILHRMEIISSKSRPVDATMVRISRSVF